MIFDSMGGVRVLFRSSSNWSQRYFAVTLNGTVNVSLIHWSMALVTLLSPPRPDILFISPRLSLFLQEPIEPRMKRRRRRGSFLPFLTRNRPILLNWLPNASNNFPNCPARGKGGASGARLYVS